MKLTIDSSIDSIDLSPLKHLVDWSPGVQYFDLAAGKEHYKLLAYLSLQLPIGAQVADCGTLFGCSAVALSANEKVTVHSFDIEDHLAGPGEIVKLRPNIYCHLQDCITSVPEILNGEQPKIIVLDIDPHDGKQETDFLVQLELYNYRGILICDDIHLNDAMEKFWAGVQGCFRGQLERRPACKCIDVTKYGHWSGTGIVVFDSQTIDVEVQQ